MPKSWRQAAGPAELAVPGLQPAQGDLQVVHEADCLAMVVTGLVVCLGIGVDLIGKAGVRSGSVPKRNRASVDQGGCRSRNP